MKPIAKTLSAIMFAISFTGAAELPPNTPKADVREEGAAPKGQETEALYVREWKVPSDLFVQLGMQIPKQPAKADPAPNTPAASIGMKDLLSSNGITFNQGCFAMYSPVSEKLVAKNTKAELDKIDEFIKGHLAKMKTR